ncbi:hypothetical protein [Serratia marcescens]|uniref:hypothetical protein n=1 Tax=Serratia marcescens TaxID=615 RepID=UPI0007C8A5F0|nr:hypothetical protein [Serratia marcescens]OAH29116.1 hypothetical protein AYJ10_05705 [Serratia marcescens]
MKLLYIFAPTGGEYLADVNTSIALSLNIYETFRHYNVIPVNPHLDASAYKTRIGADAPPIYQTPGDWLNQCGAAIFSSPLGIDIEGREVKVGGKLTFKSLEELEKALAKGDF